MGHGFGELYKLRGIVTFVISPFEQRAYGGAIKNGIPNMFRRFRESVFYVVPPLALGYVTYDAVERKHKELMRKNPADFENES